MCHSAPTSHVDELVVWRRERDGDYVFMGFSCTLLVQGTSSISLGKVREWIFTRSGKREREREENTMVKRGGARRRRRGGQRGGDHGGDDEAMAMTILTSRPDEPSHWICRAWPRRR